MPDKEESKKEEKRMMSPLKEITQAEGFDELNSLKDVVKPLKEITDDKGFRGLDSLKDIFTPLKEVSVLDPLMGKKSNDGKDSKGSKGKDDD